MSTSGIDVKSWSLSGKPCPPQATTGYLLGTIEFKGSLTPALDCQKCCNDSAQVRLDVAHLRLMSRKSVPSSASPISYGRSEWLMSTHVATRFLSWCSNAEPSGQVRLPSLRHRPRSRRVGVTRPSSVAWAWLESHPMVITPLHRPRASLQSTALTPKTHRAAVFAPLRSPPLASCCRTNVSRSDSTIGTLPTT